MYLSRIHLDVSKRSTMSALVQPNQFHGAVESAFPGERKRRLWRIDHLNEQACLLILSKDKPDLTAMARQFSAATGAVPWEVRDYDTLLARIQSGDRWHFRLVANPTKSSPSKPSAPDQPRGKVHAHVSVYYQKQWLLERAEKHGFSLLYEEFDVVSSRWFSFRKSAGGQRVTLFAVAYEGFLTVTDASLFREVLTGGLGRGKSYGMGLLTVAGAQRSRL